ncbi:MAG: Nif3-like dinuclear metal center hexameric protein [Flavobacteriaceae bacterium]|nr:Nif3-like dinuclear metal center hexameric protein [Flavobacteriaceae bacterium]
MKVRDIINYLEEIAPLDYAEDFDNVGLLVGDYKSEVTGVLVTLDTLENIIDEAIAKNCNMIVSFHPIVFSGLKKINGSNYVERVVLKAIKNDIAIYSMHTALDNCNIGVNYKISEALGLKKCKILIPKKGTMINIACSIHTDNIDKIKEGLNNVKAQNFTFIKEENTFIGHILTEKALKNDILNLLNKESDLYSFNISKSENTSKNIGIGMVGELDKELTESEFLGYLKVKMNTKAIRHSKKMSKKIKKVAVLGGSGSFAISKAIGCGADAYVSSDFKYHDFFRAENKILLCDIGHYESEQYTKNLLVELLNKKFTNFAIILSTENTNPIYYI